MVLRTFLFSLLLILVQGNIQSQDTARIMYYNILNYPGSTPERVSYFRTINQFVKPDILLVNELWSDDGAMTLLNQGLNVFGEDRFDKAIFTNGPDSDNMLFYDSTLFTFYSQDTIQTALRLINEYVLYYKSPDLAQNPDTVFLYLYEAHLKASPGSTNKAKRLAEVTKFIQHVNNKPNIENIFFGGDFNFYSATEPAYDSLINTGLFPLNDVLEAGSWHDNSNFAQIHSQSTRKSQFGGGASGGIDDRFDFMLYSSDIISDLHGIEYIPGTYHSVGNDGNHFNMSINDEPTNESVPDSVLQALYFMSDHLPIASDFIFTTSAFVHEVNLDVKVYLEGSYTNNGMDNNLNGIMPLYHPYSNPPFNYEGVEEVIEIPSSDIVDWVLVELRDAPSAELATNETVIERKAAFLKTDGSIVDLDGTSPLSFSISISNSLFVVLLHRNHLGIISSQPLVSINNSYFYNFTDAVEKAYGSIPQKEVDSGIWSMIAADGNADGTINNLDNESTWSTQTGEAGYKSGDFNMDTQVDNKDKDNVWVPNEGKDSQVPD